ncbi:MAG: homoserine O-acetyltransferase [Desulfobacterales bacterium]|nr:homoserine O-acetyltransferase [Desulfobacterales bacterium]MCP4161150.1 homoserine O-acetyltransferase [Deltaproteobacteria bacterium]
MKRLVAVLFVIMLATPAIGYKPLVKKNAFEMKSYTTVGGKTIKKVRVGWETYGSLNASKDNVILICHYFTGNSHAAGKYSFREKNVGYWDSIIGSGKPIDTDKFHIISVDSLVNLSTGNPNVITTGPASINPDSGKPYGMTFPIVTIRDFVNVQKALLDSLGVKKLHAVIGPSMGSLQAYEWASAYPEMVSRLIPVIGAGYTNGNLIAWLNIWASPIMLDKNWRGGDYYNGQPPLRGLTEALKIVTLHSQSWEWSNGVFGRTWANKNKNPLASFSNQYKIEAVLNNVGKARAKSSDANHFLYLVKANQLFLTGHGKSLIEGLHRINSPTLIIHTDEDLIFFPEEVRETAVLISSDSTPVKIVELQGARGHLDGVLSIKQAGAKIKEFLEK